MDVPLRARSTHSRRSSSRSIGGSSHSSNDNAGGDESASHSRSPRRRKRMLSLSKSKNYGPHLPAYPSLIPAVPVVLDPVPNTHTRSICVSSDSLVTVHKNGVRIYRERRDGDDGADAVHSSLSAPRDSNLTSGVWEMKELRDGYNLKDAYLVAAIQPVFHEGTGPATTPYSRYFCVATGNDHTAHSVCVLSTAGHFTLHHELHGRNKVVALHFAQLALEPFQESRRTPMVLSVDEMGEVVLFNVAKDSAVKLRQREAAGLSSISESDLESRRPAPHHVNTRAEEAHIMDEINFYEVVNKPKEGNLLFRRPGPGEDTASPRAYRLESGVATAAVLVGPCVELCSRCRNLFSQPTARAAEPVAPTAVSRSAVRAGGTGDTSLGATPLPPPPTGRFVALSIVLSSRARDVDTATTTAARVGDSAHAGVETAESAARQSAELGVTFLRVLCSLSSAYVWHEVDLVREVAPADVCDAGVALYAHPYVVGRPMTVLVGRPRLRVWCLSGCTGQLLQTRRVYEDSEGSGLGKRNPCEFFTRWLPLGKQVLVSGTEHERPWLCVAAVTDDDVILLLGRNIADEREGRRSAGADVAEAVTSNYTSKDTRMEADCQQYEQQERQMLEAWLDEIEDPGCAGDPDSAAALAPSPAAKEEDGRAPCGAEWTGGGGGSRAVTGTHAVPVPFSKRINSPLTKDYTVMMELYSPHHSLAGHLSRRRQSGKGRVVENGSVRTSHRSSSSRSASSSVWSSPSTDTGTTSGSGERKRKRRSHSHRHYSQQDDASSISGGGGDSPRMTRATAKSPRGGGIKDVFADAARNALFVFLKDEKSILRVALPFVPGGADAGQGPKEEGEVPQGAAPREEPTQPLAATQRERSCCEMPGPLRSESRPGNQDSPPGTHDASSPSAAGAVAGLWASTRKTFLPSTAASWLGFVPSATAAGGNKTAPKVDEAIPAPCPAEEISHGFNLMRPLAAAMFGWGSPDAAPTTTSSLAKEVPADPVPSAQAPASAGQGSDSKRPTVDAAGEDPPSPRPASDRSSPSPRRVEAVRISFEGSAGSSRGSHAKRKVRRESATHYTTVGSLANQGNLQRLYMQEQVQSVLTKEGEVALRQPSLSLSTQCNDDGTSGSVAARAVIAQSIQADLLRLVQREEPTARNTLLNTWQDAHNQLYIDFSLTRDAMTESEECRKAEKITRLRRERELYLRDLSPLAMMAGGGKGQDGSISGTAKALNMGEGNRSVKFVQQYQAIVDRRSRLRDRRGVFDFASYFATGVLPQQLVDLQERDKCRFELADLGIRQARDLAALDPVEVVHLYQNEERHPSTKEALRHGKGQSPRPAGPSAWKPHPTFPYDDEDGSVADIFAWNATADPEHPGKYVWDTTETEADVPVRSAAGSPVRIRAVTRELRGWTLGAWEYAARWPSVDGGSRQRQGGGSLAWSDHEEPTSAVRRRRLSRRRINVKTQAARERMMAEHQRQLEELQRELNL